MVARSKEWEIGKLDDGSKKIQTFSCKVSAEDVMCSMMTIVNSIVLCIGKSIRVNLKSYHRREKL